MHYKKKSIYINRKFSQKHLTVISYNMHIVNSLVQHSVITLIQKIHNVTV